MDNFSSRWHIVFELNGSTFLFLALAYIATAFGAFIYPMRILGALALPIFNLLLFSTLIVTAVYRFRRQGRLCALNESPSFYLTGGKYREDWSYAYDGEVIVTLWGLQLFMFIATCLTCLTPLTANHMPTKEQQSSASDSIR
mgnify:CR=1 FL=1